MAGGGSSGATEQGPATDAAGRLAFALVCAYAALLPLMGLADARLLGQQVALADWLFVPAALAAGASIFAGGWRRLGPFELLLAGYLAAAVVSVALADDPAAGLPKLPKIAYLVTLAAVTRYVVCGRRRLEVLVAAWLAGATAAVALSLAGFVMFYAGWDTQAENPFLHHYGTLPRGRYPRVRGLFWFVNMACNYLLVSLAIAWSRWHESGRGRHGWLVAGLLFAALATVSPGVGGLALALALLAVALPPPGRRRLAPVWRRTVLAAGVTAALVMLAAVLLYPGRLAPSGRLLTWEQALAGFLERPLVGNGLGAAPAHLGFRQPDAGWTYLTDAHNVVLSVAFQMGLLGLAALGLVLWRAAGPAVVELWRSLRREAAGPPLARALAVAVIVAWLYHGLSGSFEDARHLWLLLGLLASSPLTVRRL